MVQSGSSYHFKGGTLTWVKVTHSPADDDRVVGFITEPVKDDSLQDSFSECDWSAGHRYRQPMSSIAGVLCPADFWRATGHVWLKMPTDCDADWTFLHQPAWMFWNGAPPPPLSQPPLTPGCPVGRLERQLQEQQQHLSLNHGLHGQHTLMQQQHAQYLQLSQVLNEQLAMQQVAMLQQHCYCPDLHCGTGRAANGSSNMLSTAAQVRAPFDSRYFYHSSSSSYHYKGSQIHQTMSRLD